MVKQLWPYIEGYVEQLLRDTVEPAVQGALPSYLKSFKFEKIRLGAYVSIQLGNKLYSFCTCENVPDWQVQLHP